MTERLSLPLCALKNLTKTKNLFYNRAKNKKSLKAEVKEFDTLQEHFPL